MQEGGKRSAWMTHVKKTMRANKGKPLSAVLKMAAKTYKKTAKVSKKTRRMFKLFGGVTTSAGPGASTAGELGGQTGGRRSRRGGVEEDANGKVSFPPMQVRKGGDYHTGGTNEMGGRRRGSKKNGFKLY